MKLNKHTKQKNQQVRKVRDIKRKNRCKKNEHTTLGYSIEGNVRQGRREAV